METEWPPMERHGKLGDESAIAEFEKHIGHERTIVASSPT